MKQMLGIAVIALLTGILILNFMDKDGDKANIVDVSGDTSVKGAIAVSPSNSNVESGEIAPDFELETLSGEKVRLSDFKGKKVFLNFWASWCAPCRLEMPEMQQFYEEYKDDIVILAVNEDTNVNKAKDYVQDNKYTYPVLLDKDKKAIASYNVYAFPTTFFIGTDGKLQQTHKVGPMDKAFMIEMMNALK